MRIFKTLSILPLVLLASACGMLVTGQTQEITFQTPGAQEAKCDVNNGNHYVVTPGETILVMRSEKDMVIDCYAAGNRHVRKVVPVMGNEWAVGDVATGVVPGVAVDHFSGGLYKYPDVITIDFVGVPTWGNELPSYHNKDAPSPYNQAIEYYGPTVPKLESDRTEPRREVGKRNPTMNSNPFSGASATPPPAPSAVPPMTPSKPGMTPMPSDGSIREQLTRSMNPRVFNE